MLSYASDLAPRLRGRAASSAGFACCEYMPAETADKVIVAAKAARVGELTEEGDR